MKKTMKKLITMFLSLTMVMGLGATAFAAGNDGSIVIDNATSGQTYEIYKVFDATYSGSNVAYTITETSKNTDLISALKGDDSVFKLTASVNDSSVYVVTVKDDTEDDALIAYVKSIANLLGDPVASETASGTSVTFDGLGYGYYYVTSTLGTLVTINSAVKDVTIQDKNVAPTTVKTVEEDSNKTYGTVNDADINQTINFKSTITAQLGAEGYVYHDKMDKGLTYGSVTGITLNGNTVAESNYNITAPATDEDTFDVTFTQDFCDTLKANDEIVISYTAALNAEAVIGGTGNLNTGKIEYGDESNRTTSTESITTTYTWSFDVLKYANGNENDVLEGASFVLLNSDKSKQATIVDGKLTGWADKGTTLTTDANGKIEISGLDGDTYYLHETEAPAGYNLLSDDVEVKITPTTSDSEMTLSKVTAKVENKSGTVLPTSGGIGTIVFYAAGAILILGAAMLLVSRKRREQ